MPRNKIVLLLFSPILVYLAYLLSRLAWFDSLTTLANDSVHYLVMAKHYSFWVNESEAISTAWLLQDFPPFFPWVLALSGAAHSLLFAHILVISLGLISLYFYYILAHRMLENRIWAIFPIVIFSLSPGFILSLQGILSESLYLFLTLIFMSWYKPEVKEKNNQLAVAVLLLTAILLTRTIGIALCLALLIHASFHSISLKKIQTRSIYVVSFSMALYYIIMTIWGPVHKSHYFDVVIPFINGQGLTATGTGGTYNFSLISQLLSMSYGWASFWIIDWTNKLSAIYIVTMFLLFISLIGLLIRLIKNKYDAWYVLLFLSILLLWPHPGQLFRLISPIMPLLLVYVGYAVIQLPILRKPDIPKGKIAVVLYLLFLSIVLPSHAFMHARLDIAEEIKRVPIHETFRRFNASLADTELLLHDQILRDFKKVSDSVLPDEKVMYFMPSYLAVLSDRIGVITPSSANKEKYIKIVKENNVQYIFFTRFHPRNASLAYNGLKGIEHIEGWTKLIWCTQLYTKDIASCLYKVKTTATRK